MAITEIIANVAISMSISNEGNKPNYQTNGLSWKEQQKVLPWMFEGDLFLDTDPGLTEPSLPVLGGTK